jgi:hypothetical protein
LHSISREGILTWILFPSLPFPSLGNSMWAQGDKELIRSSTGLWRQTTTYTI